MGLAKGRIKTGGRKKGTPNKKSALIKTLCFYLVDGGYEKFKQEFNKLKGKEYVDTFIKFSRIALDDTILIKGNDEFIDLINEKLNTQAK